jgi:hypothetical protein
MPVTNTENHEPIDLSYIDQLIMDFYSQGGQMPCNEVADILNSNFVSGDIQYVLVSPSEFGFASGASSSQMIAKAEARGLEVCRNLNMPFAVRHRCHGLAADWSILFPTRGRYSAEIKDDDAILINCLCSCSDTVCGVLGHPLDESVDCIWHPKSLWIFIKRPN